jgi:hypothetical protein
MSLTVGGKKGNGGDSVFVNRRTITGVENFTGKYNSDIAMKIYFDKVRKKDGEEYEPSLLLFANYKREESFVPADNGRVRPGKILGWGQAFKIARMLERVGGWSGDMPAIEDPVTHEKVATGEIPDVALKTLLGKECYTLSYPATKKDGSGSSFIYQTIAAIQMWDKDSSSLIDGGEWLRKEFDRELANGYIKDFRGHVQGAPSTHTVTGPDF